MRLLMDVPIIIANLPTYIIVKQHRLKVNTDKSIWTITFQEELDCFGTCYHQKWVLGSIGWGLHLVHNQVTVLGKSSDGDDLKLAKFVSDSSFSYWHGYPVDYRDKKRESCPPEHILKMWVTSGIISKPQMSRIMGGRKCAL